MAYGTCGNADTPGSAGQIFPLVTEFPVQELLPDQLANTDVLQSQRKGEADLVRQLSTALTCPVFHRGTGPTPTNVNTNANIQKVNVSNQVH